MADRVERRMTLWLARHKDGRLPVWCYNKTQAVAWLEGDGHEGCRPPWMAHRRLPMTFNLKPGEKRRVRLIATIERPR